MKKFIALLLAMMMVFALCACGADSEDGDTFVFKQGMDESFPPYAELGNDGEVTGFDVELGKAVADYLGWEYEAVPFNWDAKDAELQAGSCDCIWSGFTVEGREDNYCWSIPYSTNTQVILVKEDSGIKTLNDLEGKVVGVQADTSALSMLEEEGAQEELAKTFAELKTYENYTIALNDLMAGAIDAIAIDVTTGTYLISDKEGFAFLEEELGVETYAAGFRLDDQELADQVSEAIQALWDNGTIAKILENPDYAEIAPYISVG